MGGCEPIYFQVLPSYILMMSPKPMLPPTMFREDTDVATNVDYDVDFSSGCVLMLPKSPPTHRVYMIHYSNAHTPRISLADGKHTGLAYISKSTIYFIIVSQSAVKFRNALDMRSLQSILCLFT